MIVSKHARVLVGACCALATTATIAAASPPPPADWEQDVLVPVEVTPPVEPVVVVEQQVAVDPIVVVTPDPIPDPYYAQPYYEPYIEPVDEGPRESIVVTGSAMQAWLSRPSGLEVAARGGTIGFSWLQRRGDFPTGVEVTGVFLVGDQMTSYALSSRVVGSPKLGKRLVVPYAAVGIAIGASRVVDRGVAAMQKDPMSAASYGFAIGPSAEVGLHGFLSKQLYWRAGAGFVGAGVGAITADAGVGFVLD